MVHWLRRRFIAGFFVTVPLFITVAAFIWIFGIDANPEGHRYDLWFNNQLLLSFRNPLTSNKSHFLVRGNDGSSLDFRTTMLDKYDDPMGYAVLTVPSSLLVKGKTQLIRVVGESAGSRSWYMTFESPVEEKVWFAQQEAVRRTPDGERFSGLFNFVHLGEPEGCTIRVRAAIGC